MENSTIKNRCFFTGHRYISLQDTAYIKSEIIRLCEELINNHNVNTFIAGGALGFDTIAALTVLELKKKYPHIKLHLYFPCTDQTKKWTERQKELWEKIKCDADNYRYITNSEYVNGCMQLRNRAMVEDAYYGIAYCTKNFGGTASTVKFAAEKSRKIAIIKKASQL